VFTSTIDKKTAAEVDSSMQSTSKVHDTSASKSQSLSRRLGIRDLPMPPMPSDDEAEEDETDMISELDLRKKEDELCDTIVKAFMKNKQEMPSPADTTCQETLQRYVLIMIFNL